jgi:excinuclease ABC subunit C
LAICGISVSCGRKGVARLNNPLLATLPHQPGVYLMRDSAGGILYIGKAIDLRKRVANYFRPDVEPKIRALMADVRHIDYIAAAGERDALVMNSG